jgi:hypothetical protein
MDSWLRRRGIRGALAVGVLMLATQASMAQERAGSDAHASDGSNSKPPTAPAYFMCIFAYETTPRAAQTAHTFATFVKSDGPSFEAHTISWLPQRNVVRLVRRFGEPGVNHDLRATLEIARVTQAEVKQWGPFEIKSELYERALRQIERLKSGRIAYKALDGAGRPESITNCIHAVADIDMDRGMLTTGRNYGIDASALVVEHLGPWIVNPSRTHAWVSEKLGLARTEFAVQK